MSSVPVVHRTYESSTGLFTPRDYDTDQRLRFDAKDVLVVGGEPDRRRGPGVKGIVEINGVRYRVYGASCGLPNCMCDSRIRRIP